MEKVEKFKLTKEQIAWSKEYSKVMKIAQILNHGMLKSAQQTRGLGDLLKQSEEQLQQLIQQAPSRATHELPEQDLQEAYKGFQINY